jgi:hypothetical protein
VIEAIRQKVSEGRFEFTEHAVDQSIVRRISMAELRQTFASGEIIEDYPDDKYGPSCLILGYTENQRPIHVQCSHPTRDILKIITVYQPDPSQWINNRTRKPLDDL